MYHQNDIRYFKGKSDGKTHWIGSNTNKNNTKWFEWLFWVRTTLSIKSPLIIGCTCYFTKIMEISTIRNMLTNQSLNIFFIRYFCVRIGGKSFCNDFSEILIDLNRFVPSPKILHFSDFTMILSSKCSLPRESCRTAMEMAYI